MLHALAKGFTNGLVNTERAPSLGVITAKESIVMKKLMLVGIFSVVAALTGCGAPAPVGSCQAPAAGGIAYCIDYTGSSVTIEAVQQGCSGAMGTYQSAVCATASRVGRCTLPGGGAALTQTANFYAPTTADQAQAACTALMGTYAAN